jgi:hypothetical protein
MEQAVIFSEIAGFACFDDAVTANCGGTNTRCAGATITRFRQAGDRTTVFTDGITVVAVFRRGNDAITTDRRTAFTGDAALPTGFDRGAVSGATVARERILIVARFDGREETIAADSGIATRLSPFGTVVIGFDLAERTASVIRCDVSVVTLFVWVLQTVSTIFPVTVEDARDRRVTRTSSICSASSAWASGTNACARRTAACAAGNEE